MTQVSWKMSITVIKLETNYHEIYQPGSVGNNAKVGNNARIGNNVKIGNNARIGNNSGIGNNAKIGNNAMIGKTALVYCRTRWVIALVLLYYTINIKVLTLV